MYPSQTYPSIFKVFLSKTIDADLKWTFENSFSRYTQSACFTGRSGDQTSVPIHTYPTSVLPILLRRGSSVLVNELSMRPGNVIKQIPEICILEDVPLGLDLSCTWTKTCQKNYLSIYNLIIEGKLSSLIKRLGWDALWYCVSCVSVLFLILFDRAGHKKSDGDLTKAEGVFLCVVGELLRRIFGPTSPASDFFEMPIYQRTHIIQSYRYYARKFPLFRDDIISLHFQDCPCSSPVFQTVWWINGLISCSLAYCVSVAN